MSSLTLPCRCDMPGCNRKIEVARGLRGSTLYVYRGQVLLGGVALTKEDQKRLAEFLLREATDAS